VRWKGFAILLGMVTLSWTAKGAEGDDYHVHDPADPGYWIWTDFSRCCGKDDCARLPDDGVIRLPDGGYFVVETQETIPGSSGSIEPSQDGFYWRCRYTSGERMNMTRCLFVPPLGF
jgi:hypothetical protein